MNKKHVYKRKKVVVDALDGKIINEPTALKISNVELYLEKNGFKVIKLFTIFLLFSLFIPYVHADSYNLNYMTKLDLINTNNVYLLIAVFVFAIILFIYSINYNQYYVFIISCIMFLMIGFILILNGFNVVLSLLLIITSLALMGIGSGM